MKIFISHSSRDKWIARRISDDLVSFGAETFLDEKDIATGDSIDDAIQEHLKSCDELLILISPSALDSHWVMIELGGAKALGLRLAPILLHVGANEVPSPISKHLLRDLNQIDKYYDEVKGKLSGSAGVVTTETEISPQPARSTPFDVGDRVVITGHPDGDVQHGDFYLSWLDPVMEQYKGKEAIVTLADKDGTVRLDIDGSKLWWAVEWLQKRAA